MINRKTGIYMYVFRSKTESRTLRVYTNSCPANFSKNFPSLARKIFQLPFRASFFDRFRRKRGRFLISIGTNRNFIKMRMRLIALTKSTNPKKEDEGQVFKFEFWRRRIRKWKLKRRDQKRWGDPSFTRASSIE